MTKNYYKNYEFFFWSFLIVFASIFLCFWKYQKGLFFGFAIGSLVSYFFYKLNVISTSWVLTTTKKLPRYVFYFIKYLLYYGFLFLIFYLSVKANGIYQARFNTQNYYYNPINFIAMVFGFSLNFVVIISLHLVEIIKEKKEKTKKGEYARKT